MKNYTNKMQKIALAVILCLLSFGSVFAQAETTKIKDGTISSGATKAKDGAIFELESNNKGMLISRLSTAQRNAIPAANLSNGLLIFNTNSNCFDYWDSLRVQWLSMCGTPPPAVFDVSAAQCSLVIANGTYKQGVTLSGDNTLTVPVTVTQAGTYTMTATTANGYYFEASGNFPSAGVYDITLKGTGRPNSGYDTGTPGDVVTVILNGVVCDCTPHIYIEKANVDFAISCGSLDRFGSYNIGIPLTADNKLTLDVNVSNTGFWSMKTNTVNGYSFMGQGTFTTTGLQKVVLSGTGTPIASGTNLFDITSNASTVAGGSCNGISVIVAPVAFTMDCAGATQTGVYMQNVALNSTNNTITLPINVTATGATTISTNTVNGVSFSSGAIVLTKLGADTVVLKGSGTPTSGATAELTVTGTQTDPATCFYNLTIAKQPIAFTMTCNSITTSGSYVPNVAMTSENSMAVPVNVTYVGDYSISTNTLNGISFSATGTFTTTGAQTITLKASGTPTAGGSYSYAINTNSTSSSVTCSKAILFTYRQMIVAGIGDGLYNPGSAASGETSYAVLNNTTNFGPNGKIQVLGGLKLLPSLGYPSASSLKNSINNNNIDIIHIAYNFQPNADVIAVLADFVKNKKGVVIFASERVPNIATVINGILGSNVSTVAANNSVGRNITDLANIADPILNGPFGNTAGLNMGGDVDNSIFLVEKPANSTVLATEKGSSKVFSFRDNTYGFVFIGDAGYNAGVVNNNQNGNYPAKIGTGGVPMAKANYGYDSNVTVYNSIFYANLFAWAVDYVQNNTVQTYKLP
ncbi:hypothetical protein [Flavobacterium sp. AJR]|uniref:hypothetical protein n=1 Tax=Flavobacterium sp. AJR TaxID=1979369 RepID=UPI000A3D8831|nr:hypothetical protein [Flavobacterium sp. AJR]OUL59925.1 hypothetical protein B8T70_23035 [Flavobacterium sp. AJR]